MTCCGGIVQMLVQLVNQITEINANLRGIQATLQTVQTSQAQMTANLADWQENQLWLAMEDKDVQKCMELRQSRNQGLQGDSLRHLAQYARGDLWGMSPGNLKVVARMLADPEHIYSRGQLPVNADKMRGQYAAVQHLLEQHQLVASDPEWADGTTALALSRIQAAVVQESEGRLQDGDIDQIMGISAQLRAQINQAVSQAPIIAHTQGNPVVPHNDPAYAQTLGQMLPRARIQAMTGFQPR